MLLPRLNPMKEMDTLGKSHIEQKEPVLSHWLEAVIEQ